MIATTDRLEIRLHHHHLDRHAVLVAAALARPFGQAVPIESVVEGLDGPYCDAAEGSVRELLWDLYVDDLIHAVTVGDDNEQLIDDAMTPDDLDGVIVRAPLRLVRCLTADDLVRARPLDPHLDEDYLLDVKDPVAVPVTGPLADALVDATRAAISKTSAPPDLVAVLVLRTAVAIDVAPECARVLVERAVPAAREALAREVARPYLEDRVRRAYASALWFFDVDDTDRICGAARSLVLDTLQMVDGERVVPVLLSPELERALNKNTPAGVIDGNHVRARLRALARRKKRSKNIDAQLIGYVVSAILDAADLALYRVAPDKTRQLATDSRGCPIDASRAIAMAMPSIGAAFGKTVPFHAVLEVARESLVASATAEVTFDALVAKARRAYAPAQDHRLVADVKRAQRDEATRLRRARLVARRFETPTKKTDNE